MLGVTETHFNILMQPHLKVSTEFILEKINQSKAWLLPRKRHTMQHITKDVFMNMLFWG